jgi:hypothetical protein
MSKGPCSVEGCENSTHAQGYCQRHYRLWKKYGVPENKPRDQYEKPGPKIDPSKPRSKAHGGLKLTCVNGHEFTPENTSFNTSGKRVCLTCKAEKARDLCRHGHLLTEDNVYVDNRGARVCRTCRRAAVAKWRSTSDYEEQQKTHCKRGHEFTEENTAYGYKGKRRICITCQKEDAVRRIQEREEKTHCANGHEYAKVSWYHDTFGNKVCHQCRKDAADRKRLKDYNVSLETYREMEERQGHMCAICRAPFTDLERKPAIDHFHDCCPKGSSCGGCVRGLLCHRCNTVLGMMNDSPEVLIRAAEYLMEATKFRARMQ